MYKIEKFVNFWLINDKNLNTYNNKKFLFLL